ncbi:MAG: T9SS type A sorting domain-containing protein [Dysgonamonadaceae bacterium]|nr:T9SS type A sorting domain-containing protein [Dysgonamonadaceae bacterium]
MAVIMMIMATGTVSSKDNSGTVDGKGSKKTPFAVEYLAAQVRENSSKLVVYSDFGDGNALFTQRAALNPNSAPEVNPVMDEKADSPYGISCIHVTYPFTALDWNGFMFVTGRLDKDSIVPKIDFGETNTGFDLSGATRLTFKAKGKTGKEVVRFYIGGLGGTDAPFHDSDQIFYTENGSDMITLSTDWKEYEIDLTGADLSRIGNGFAWVTSIIYNLELLLYGINAIEFDIDEIAYHFDYPRQEPIFLRSYGILPVSDARSFINNFSYTYDNALLAIVLAKKDYLDEARQVADALTYCVFNDRYYAPGPLRNAYANGSPKSFPGWTSPRGGEFAMLPGFYDTDVPTWYEDRYAVSINTGVMAWAIEALLTVYDYAKTPEYLDASIVMADYLIANYKAYDALGGYTGGEEGWEGNTEKLTYKSTEHNIDLVAAFAHLARILEDSQPQKAELYLAESRNAREFVLAMYEDGCFFTGTGLDGITINRDNKPLDTNTWSILTLLDDAEVSGRWDPEKTYSFIQKTFKTGQGVDYNQDCDYIWNEGTGQLAVVAAKMGKTADYQSLMDYLNSAAEIDGSICSASHDGLTTGFDSQIATEDGLKSIPWVYDHRVSLASTAWLALAQSKINPYFTEIKSVANSAFSVFPNPAVNEFTVSGLKGGEKISIYDLYGQLCAVEQASETAKSVSTSRLLNGIYLVNVTKDGFSESLKLLVKH